MVVPIPTTHMIIGLAAVVVSIPLILRLVPPNRFYGVRNREAFASERNWYAINAFGGALLLVFGAFVAGFGWCTRDRAPSPSSLSAPWFTALPILALVPVLLLIRLYSRRLRDR